MASVTVEQESTNLRIDPITVARYSAAKCPWLRGDYLYGHLGKLAGAVVLELGSGDGMQSVLMALMGARVLGVESDPRAVATARRRAVANSVEHLCEFVGIQEGLLMARADRRFDKIIGTKVVSRRLLSVSPLAANVLALLRPGGQYAFIEELREPYLLTRLRHLLGRSAPGAAKLSLDETAELSAALPGSRLRYFGFATSMLLAANFAPNYERSSRLAQLVYDAAGIADGGILGLPGGASLAASVVITGTKD